MKFSLVVRLISYVFKAASLTGVGVITFSFGPTGRPGCVTTALNVIACLGIKTF